MLGCRFLRNFATEHDTAKLVTSFHSESPGHSNDINISQCSKLSKIGQNLLIIDLAFHQIFAIFKMHLKL